MWQREMRVALAGAVVFIILGSLQACASDTLLGPQEETVLLNSTTDDGEEPPTCTVVNGVLVCR